MNTNAIITPAGRPLFSSNAARELHARLIEARPHLLPILATGGRKAHEASIALGLMVGYETAAAAGDADATDQFARQFDSYTNRIGYNPLSPSGR
jgi:hypothetical protein